MNFLANILIGRKRNFSLYLIAEGEEEYRVKREILSNMEQSGGRAAFDVADECGSLRPNRNRDNA